MFNFCSIEAIKPHFVTLPTPAFSLHAAFNSTGLSEGIVEHSEMAKHELQKLETESALLTSANGISDGVNQCLM